MMKITNNYCVFQGDLIKMIEGKTITVMLEMYQAGEVPQLFSTRKLRNENMQNLNVQINR